MALADFGFGALQGLDQLKAQRQQEQEYQLRDRQLRDMVAAREFDRQMQTRRMALDEANATAERERAQRQQAALDSVLQAAAAPSVGPGRQLAGGDTFAGGMPAEGPLPGAGGSVASLNTPEGRLRLRAAGVDPNAIFGNVRQPEQARPTRYVPRTMRVGGRDRAVNFDPASGGYFDPDNGQRLTGVQPVPPRLPRGAGGAALGPDDYLRVQRQARQDAIDEFNATKDPDTGEAPIPLDELIQQYESDYLGMVQGIQGVGADLQRAGVPGLRVGSGGRGGGFLRTGGLPRPAIPSPDAAGVGAPASGGKLLSRAELRATAQRLGISEGEAEQQARARGYVVQ